MRGAQKQHRGRRDATDTKMCNITKRDRSEVKNLLFFFFFFFTDRVATYDCYLCNTDTLIKVKQSLFKFHSGFTEHLRERVWV